MIRKCGKPPASRLHLNVRRWKSARGVVSGTQTRMKWRFGNRAGNLAIVANLALLHGAPANCAAAPQAPKQTTSLPAQAVKQPVDPAVDGAQSLVGRALFLRGFYSGNELEYDANGHVKGGPKPVDWTLAGVEIDRISRRGAVEAGELVLEGLRVAVRYNPDQHVFERHPQTDEKLRIMLALNPEAHGLQAALATIFAVGIDPALQRAMPPEWRHYFAPRMPWPNDDLTGEDIIPSNAPLSAGVEYPVPEKKLEPDFTNEARQDHVKGSVQVRLVVGTDGLPRRIAIKQPLGYGLDAKVVQTVQRYRFHPGMKDGKPVAVEMIVNQGFDAYPAPVR